MSGSSTFGTRVAVREGRIAEIVVLGAGGGLSGYGLACQFLFDPLRVHEEQVGEIVYDEELLCIDRAVLIAMRSTKDF